MNFNSKNIHNAATPTATVTNDNDDKDSNDDEEKKVYLGVSNLQESTRKTGVILIASLGFLWYVGSNQDGQLIEQTLNLRLHALAEHLQRGRCFIFVSSVTEREYPCNECGRSFKHEAGLRHHEANRKKSGKCASHTVRKFISVLSVPLSL